MFTKFTLKKITLAFHQSSVNILVVYFMRHKTLSPKSGEGATASGLGISAPDADAVQIRCIFV